MLITFLYFDYHSQPLFCRHFLYLLLSHLKFKFHVDRGVSKALRMPMKKLKRYFSWYEWCIAKFIHRYSLGGSKTIRRQYRQIGLVIVLHTDRGSHLRVHAIDRSIDRSQALDALFSHEKTKKWVETKACRGTFFANFEYSNSRHLFKNPFPLYLILVEENFFANFEYTAGISLRTNSLCI